MFSDFSTLSTTRSLRATLAAVGLIAFAGLAACKADHGAFEQVSVDQLESMMKEQAGLVVCDANGKDVREEYGTIPGAVLLTSYSFEAAELPDDKDAALVFYCSSERCSAAPRAAGRAQEAGFNRIYVLPAGIKGWVQAGKPVDEFAG